MNKSFFNVSRQTLNTGTVDIKKILTEFSGLKARPFKMHKQLKENRDNVKLVNKPNNKENIKPYHHVIQCVASPSHEQEATTDYE